jgi:hypothetical protein
MKLTHPPDAYNRESGSFHRADDRRQGVNENQTQLDWPVACRQDPSVSHPDPNGPPDLTPIRVGDVLENHVTGERSITLELPWENEQGRASAELTALVGARVVGEHLHPGILERFTVLEGELTVKRDRVTSVLRDGDRDDLRARAARAHQCQGHASSAAARAVRPRRGLRRAR